MIRVGSRSFFTASLLLPDDVRQGAYALYGFCRLSDDAVDVDDGGLEAVGRLRERLRLIYAGEPGHGAVDRALADAVERYAIPNTLLEALLEGLEWDARARRYETLSEVCDYAARVAGAVGAMMAALMGARSPELVARACDLGVAMQLTNIARDVGEDAAIGRLYLPRVWLREAGIDPEGWLMRPQFDPALASVIERLLDEADALYRRADAGIAHLPPAFRPAIYAARYLYAEIGVALRRRGLDSVSRRTVVPATRKAMLVGRALRQAQAKASAPIHAPPLAETLFLVEAVRREMPRGPAYEPRSGLESDVRWVVELFSRLESRPASARSEAAP
jgi:15-cis-phytoene synthase